MYLIYFFELCALKQYNFLSPKLKAGKKPLVFSFHLYIRNSFEKHIIIAINFICCRFVIYGK